MVSGLSSELIADIFNGNYRNPLCDTGEFTARFMIIAMMITPLVFLEIYRIGRNMKLIPAPAGA